MLLEKKYMVIAVLVIMMAVAWLLNFIFLHYWNERRVVVVEPIEHGECPDGVYRWCDLKQKCLDPEEEECELFCRAETSGNILTFTEAEYIASSDHECGDLGRIVEGGHVCNVHTGTWWLNVDHDKEGCNPACVVNLDTKEVEVNWRCTGAIPE